MQLKMPQVSGDFGGADLLTPDVKNTASASSSSPTVTIVTTQKPRYLIAACNTSNSADGYLVVINYGDTDSGFYIAPNGSKVDLNATYIATYMPASDTGITFNLYGFIGSGTPKMNYAVYY